MRVGHGSSSSSGTCVVCGKQTATYASFDINNDMIELKVWLCNDEYNKFVADNKGFLRPILTTIRKGLKL